MWPRLAPLAFCLLFACAAQEANRTGVAEELVRPAQEVRVARIFVEAQDRGIPWPGQLERGGDPARQIEALGAFLEGSAAIEFAFPVDLEPSFLDGVDDALHEAGFANMGSSLQALAFDKVTNHNVARYFAQPTELLSLRVDDPRCLPITGALWEVELPFDWRRETDNLVLTVPRCAQATALHHLATSRVLKEYSLDDLELPSAAHASIAATSHVHRIAVLSGPGGRAALERLEREMQHPTSPWAVEILSDEGSMHRVHQEAPQFIWRFDEQLSEGFAYSVLAGEDEVALCQAGVLYLARYSVVEAMLRDRGTEWPEIPRLWQARLPMSLVITMGAYVAVPSIHYEHALELMTAEPSVACFLKPPPALELGAPAPSLRGRFSDGTAAHLSRFRGRPVWVFFNLPLAFEGHGVREVRRAWRAASDRGVPPMLLLPAPWDEEEKRVLELLGEALAHVEYLHFDEEEFPAHSEWTPYELLRFEYGGIGFGVQRVPTGLMLDANGRIQARIRNDGIFDSFQRQMRAAVEPR